MYRNQFDLGWFASIRPELKERPMAAYTIIVYTDDDVIVAELPAVAPNVEAALDAAAPWVRQIVAQTRVRPLWYRAAWREVRRQARAAFAEEGRRA